MIQQAIAADFDLLDLHLLDPARYPHLLESVASGPQGRFDVLFAMPGESLRLARIGDFDFLERLDAWWQREKLTGDGDAELPFSGGWFLYLGYELAGVIEPQLRLPQGPSGLPVACATRIPAAIVHDRSSGKRRVIGETRSQVDSLLGDIARLGDVTGDDRLPEVELQEDAPGQYLRGVERIRDYIREGDVFQVNLSREWHAPWPAGLSSAALYRQLRRANPGPFNGLATWGQQAVLSSSPERLVEVRGDKLQTRPIAGTRPRGERAEADRQKLTELRQHPKEQAEHIMLIDLERNDLGRIAVPGSVRVSELMTLESYATVHHIVSNVEARKRPEVTPGDIIRAVFPGGTITGCPKVRCMEIIAELEQRPRGAYTGSMGYLNRDGSMDLNILIRTIVRDNGRLSFRAGAGIVYDSEPRHELDETRAKAAGMLRALQGEPA